MAEELFDVVDDQDRVIQSLPRSEVHRRKLRHRAVHVLVFRTDGSMLIHKRSASKEEFPSVWTSSCSGHVSAGESYDETAPRELFEELGITATIVRRRKFCACADTSFEFTMLYTAVCDDEINPDFGEMTEVRWMNTADILNWVTTSPDDFSPAFRLLFMSTQDDGIAATIDGS